MSNFNAVEVKDKCVQWIRDFFNKNEQIIDEYYEKIKTE